MSLGAGVLAFAAVFGGFSLYAFAATPVFQARAQILVERPDVGQSTVEPLGEVRRFEGMLYDAATLERLASDYALGSAEAARAAVDVLSFDGRNFTLRCRNRDAERARAACAFLMEAARQRASAVRPRVDPERPPSSLRAAEALAAFSKKEPAVLRGAPPGAVSAESLAEWHRLVTDTSRSSVEPPVLPRPAAVTTIAAASVPAWPIEPDRGMALSLGLAFGLFFGLAASGPRRTRKRPEPTFPEIESERLPPPVITPMLPPAAPEVPSLAAPLSSSLPRDPGSSRSHTLAGMPLADALIAGLVERKPPESVPEWAYEFGPTSHDSSGSIPSPGRSTQILGSPLPPRTVSSTPPPRSSASSKPPLEAAGARYSYVRPPSGTPDVKVRATDAELRVDPSLRPEACKPLRRELYAFGVQKCFVLGISSSLDALGAKARFATELALSLAETGHARVLLIETDSSHPSARSLLGLELPPGSSLSEQLTAYAGSEVEPAWEVVRCTKSLHFLGGGSMPPTGSLDVAFRRCIDALRGNYDFLVLHGACLTDEVTCRRLAEIVDGALVVSFDKARVEGSLGPFAGKRLARLVVGRADQQSSQGN